MEKYIVKFIDKTGKSFYADLFFKDYKTTQSSSWRMRNGLKDEGFICYQGGEFINTYDNVFTQFVPYGVEPKIMYADSIHRRCDHDHSQKEDSKGCDLYPVDMWGMNNDE